MREKRRAQSPGSTDESRELVRFSTWLLACALLLQENSAHAMCKDHDMLDAQEKAHDRGAGSRLRHTKAQHL
jgi:hypothetical protein